jgi:hypothetical protein
MLLLLPPANGYNEIDILIFLSLILVVRFSLTKGSTVSFHLVTGASCWIAVYLVPGQGVIYTMLALFYLLFIHFNNLRESQNLKSYIKGNFKNFSVLIAVLLMTVITQREQLLWVLGNSRVSNYMFGDYWLRKAFDPQVFPFSIRFLPIILAPLLLTLYISFRKHLGITSRIFLFTSIFYMILISARWFGRVDSGLSRIGIGTLIMLVFLILPIFSTRSAAFKVVSKYQALTLGLIFSLSMGLAIPANGGSLEAISPSSLSQSTYKSQIETGLRYQRIKDVFAALENPSEKVFNMTGGDALSLYTGIPGYGGIQSSYTITNDRQEKRWLDRLVRSNITSVIGGFEYPFDGSGFGGRAPLILNWLIENYQPMECGDFQIAIAKNLVSTYSEELRTFGCTIPGTPQLTLDLWNKMDSTVIDLEYSLQSWKKSKDSKQLSGAILNMPEFLKIQGSGLVNFEVLCQNSVVASASSIKLTGMRGGQKIEFTFYAFLESGPYTFNPRIFPISSFSDEALTLSIENSSCILQVSK